MFGLFVCCIQALAGIRNAYRLNSQTELLQFFLIPFSVVAFVVALLADQRKKDSKFELLLIFVNALAILATTIYDVRLGNVNNFARSCALGVCYLYVFLDYFGFTQRRRLVQISSQLGATKR